MPLIDDLADALVEIIKQNDTLFSALSTGDTGGSSDVLKVEYVREGHEAFYSGAASTARVYLLDANFETNSYVSSTYTNFTFSIMFDLLEMKNGARAKAITSSALVSIFASGGEEYFALVDEGTAPERLGGSGVVQLLSVTELPSRGDSNCILEALVSIRCWHQIPLTG